MNLKKTLLAISILLGGVQLSIAQNSNPYQAEFQLAYQTYPSVPVGILEAVSFTQTRFTDLDQTEHGCIGMPMAEGVMGMFSDGHGYFNNSKNTVAQLAGVNINSLGTPQSDILAYAAAFNNLIVSGNVSSGDYIGYELILRVLSEIPEDGNPVNNYALSAFTYSVFDFMNDEENQAKYGFTATSIDLKSIYGETNFKVLSSQKITINEEVVYDEQGMPYVPQNRSAEYGPALWVATPTCNYSSRNGTAISAVTIHTIQGTYAGAISWAQNCSANVSYHYVVRSTDGQVTQMVYEADKGWHVGSENPYTIGIEHEGYVDNPAWYTTALYTASANLVKDITQSGYGINPLRTFQGPATTGLNTLGSCVKIKGHQHYPNQSHTDPGINWNWEYYYQLINDSPSVTTYTTASGSLYDSGGQSGDYSDDERYLYLIEPANVSDITIHFNLFDLELNWDYMRIYDGNSLSSPLIGTYTGTSIPTDITSSGGAILLEFRSDCATQAAGWDISWTSVPDANPADIIAPTTAVTVLGNWQTTDFTVDFTDADNIGGSGVHQKFYQVIDFDGTEWRANANNGFFSDNFDVSIHSDWTALTGTWVINSAVLRQSDDAVNNTNIYASLDQDNYDQWLYHFGLKIGGTTGNRRGGFHFMCDDATQTERGNSYFIWLRADDNKLQIYKTVNNVFTLEVDTAYTVNADQWYDIKTVYDKTTGLIELYIDDHLEANWVDPSPYTTGNAISMRSGNSVMDINNLKVYHNRSSSELVTINIGNDVQYQNFDPLTHAAKIKSIVIDSAKNVSVIGDELVNVDWTSPTNIATVNDGTGADISTTTTSTQLSANWTTSTDQHSDLQRYWYCIGTTPLATDVVTWTDNWWSDTLTHTGLNLTIGTTYYVCVYSENGAGLFSDTTCSDGQMVTTPTGTPTANFIVPNSYICSYEAVQVQNASLDAISYSWSAPGATPSTSTAVNPVFTYATTGYYDITLTATGTGGTDTDIQTIFVNVDTIPSADFTPSDVIVDISNPFVSFTNNSLHANGYLWNFGDGNFSGDNNPWHEYAATGDYYVELIAVNGNCPNDTTEQLVQVVDNLGFTDHDQIDLQVYPIPAEEVLFIDLGSNWSDEITIQLIDYRGRIVYQKQTGKVSKVKIDLITANLQDASYILKVFDKEKAVNKKIIVQSR
ncbi:MAG: N-acetylmuramoyl-L-alanine amidase [Crocinitomicaceae bacterium]